MIRTKTVKKIKKIGIPAVIGVVLLTGGIIFVNKGTFSVEKGEKKLATYEIGGNSTNFEVRDSIIGGCGLQQFLLGKNAEEVNSDGDTTVYNYNKDGIDTWVYCDIKGEIYSVNQIMGYEPELWNDIQEFWESLDRQERMYTGWELLSKDEIDWNSPETPIRLRGNKGDLKYIFNRYTSESDGTEISIQIDKAKYSGE